MKVLLAMDASPAGEAALNEALERLWPGATSFEVLHVIEPSHVSSDARSAHEIVQRAEKLVDRAIGLLRAKGFEAMGGAFVDDDPKIIILDRASRIEADLVILGSRDRSAVDRFLLGSVAVAILRHAPCSVEIVRAASLRKDPSQSTKLLLATDGSEYSAVVTSWIARCLWSPDSEVRLLSVPEVFLPARKALLELPFLISAVNLAREEGIQRSNDAVCAAKSALEKTGLHISESVYGVDDDPRKSIREEASRWGAHLIVLGSQGRRGLDRFQLGSVSEAVAVHGLCSVAVIRKDRAETL